MSKTGDLYNSQHGGAHINQNNKVYIINPTSTLIESTDIDISDHVWTNTSPSSSVADKVPVPCFNIFSEASSSNAFFPDICNRSVAVVSKNKVVNVKSNKSRSKSKKSRSRLSRSRFIPVSANANIDKIYKNDNRIHTGDQNASSFTISTFDLNNINNIDDSDSDRPPQIQAALQRVDLDLGGGDSSLQTKCIAQDLDLNIVSKAKSERSRSRSRSNSKSDCDPDCPDDVLTTTTSDDIHDLQHHHSSKNNEDTVTEYNRPRSTMSTKFDRNSNQMDMPRSTRSTTSPGTVTVIPVNHLQSISQENILNNFICKLSTNHAPHCGQNDNEDIASLIRGQSNQKEDGDTSYSYSLEKTDQIGLSVESNTVKSDSTYENDICDSKSNNILESSLFTIVGSGNDLPESLQDFVFSSSLTPKENTDKVDLAHSDSMSDKNNCLTYSLVNVSDSDQYNKNLDLDTKPMDDSQVLSNQVMTISSGDNCTSQSHSDILIGQPTSRSMMDIDNLDQYPIDSTCDYPGSDFIVKNESTELFEHQRNEFSSFTDLIPSSLCVYPSTPVNTPSNNIMNLNDSSNELNLSSLPNFLGLENGVSNHALINQVDILEPPTTSICDSGIPMKQDSSLTTELSNSLSSSEINITTISITNDDENATKITVNSNQGEPQMYVINTSGLNIQQEPNVQNEMQQLYVVNAQNLNPTSSELQQLSHTSIGLKTASSSDTSSSGVTLNSGNPFVSGTVSEPQIPGFILVPVVDNASNVDQNAVKEGTDDESNGALKKVIRCPVPGCSKTFKKASKYKVHEMLHTGERPYKCTLLGCEWAFTTPHKLKRHMDSHEGRKDFVCHHPGCGRKFTTIYNLNTHLKLHERPCTEPCPEEGCGMSFPTKRQLDIHLRSVHQYEDHTFKCPHPGCEKVFFSSSTMGSHMRVHLQSQEDLQCKFPGCGKTFLRMCRLRQHQRSHSGDKPFVCEYEGCNWKFATSSKLKRHQTKHTGLRQWVCEICHKSFHRSEHLKGHLITHSGDRPFVCPVEGCGNTFTAKSSWYVHLKKHDDSGKTIVYHCPMEKCERHYSSKAGLRQHILHKHCSSPLKSNNNQGMVNWLSLLEPTETSTVTNLPQENFPSTGGLNQSTIAAVQDSVLANEFITNNLQSSTNVTSESNALAVASGPIISTPAFSFTTVNQDHLQENKCLDQDQDRLFNESQIQQQLSEADDIIHQERLSLEASDAVERGRKSQIMLYVNGSARTDPRSNSILSQRAVKRWKKQRDLETSKIGPQFENQPFESVMVTASQDSMYGVSNSIPLTDLPPLEHLAEVATLTDRQKETLTKVEIPDMELQAEGFPVILDTRTSITDAFMSELFVREQDTGISYRHSQLLQDDPPNSSMLEEMEGVVPTHNMGLDSSLENQFEDGTLQFQDLE